MGFFSELFGGKKEEEPKAEETNVEESTGLEMPEESVEPEVEQPEDLEGTEESTDSEEPMME